MSCLNWFRWLRFRVYPEQAGGRRPTPWPARSGNAGNRTCDVTAFAIPLILLYFPYKLACVGTRPYPACAKNIQSAEIASGPWLENHAFITPVPCTT
jgi:hypothetical protein